MNITLTFEKENDGRWYAVVPTWEGSRDDLEMVMGADLMLDIISLNWFDNDYEIMLNLDTGSNAGILNHPKVILHRIEKNTEGFGGSFYECRFGNDQMMEIWLCDVCHFVFGEFPETIIIN